MILNGIVSCVVSYLFYVCCVQLNFLTAVIQEFCRSGINEAYLILFFFIFFVYIDKYEERRGAIALPSCR